MEERNFRKGKKVGRESPKKKMKVSASLERMWLDREEGVGGRRATQHRSAPDCLLSSRQLVRLPVGPETVLLSS
jgi:hypothetical protein